MWCSIGNTSKNTIPSLFHQNKEFDNNYNVTKTLWLKINTWEVYSDKGVFFNLSILKGKGRETA